MWHVSIAWVRNGKLPRSVESWPAREKTAALELAKDLLNGVGEGKIDYKDGPTAVHLRKRLHASEIAMLSPEWLAIPAVDPGHPED